jgi:hypothetical protein
MPGALLQVTAVMACPHASGQLKAVPSSTHVLVSGAAVATLADQFTISGCLFTVPGPKAQPCMSVQWTSAATRVQINGSPALLQTSQGSCLSADQIPAGPPVVSVNQSRVTGT